MSLVRDSIAGRLAAARNARAKTLVGVAGTGVVSWNCSAGTRNTSKTAAFTGLKTFEAQYQCCQFHTCPSRQREILEPESLSAGSQSNNTANNPSPPIRFIRLSERDYVIPIATATNLSAPIRFIQPSSAEDLAKQSEPSIPTHDRHKTFIAASKFTGTKKWSRRLQRQRIVRRTYPSRNATSNDQNVPPDAEILWQTQTPSEALISALQSIGHEVKIHQVGERTKRDLSWLHPARLRREKELVWGGGVGGIQLIPGISKFQVMRKPARVSYPTIVAAYIRKIVPLLQRASESGDEAEDNAKLDEALLDVFNDEALKYLSDRGYSPTDVVNWAWILTGRTPLEAVKRYHALEQSRHTHGQVLLSPAEQLPIPPFVLLFILRQENISADALQYLIIHTSNLLFGAISRLKSARNPSTSTAKPPWNPFVNPDSVMMLVIRLLRAARAVWPSAYLSIAQIFTSVLGHKPLSEYFGNESQNYTLRLRLVQQYNKFLDLISIPCAIHPFHSNSIQQRAQFNLLREMTKFTPPLVVNRMGFQAITRVQIAHARTDTERDWAKSQLKSWPPWKEPRLGIDPIKGEGSESRAARAVGYMISAGYSLSVFDQTARIVAGWDTDMTPTIQTRTLARRASSFQLKHGPMNPRVWSARIRATRTLKEAWAWFLAYEDCGGKAHNDVYFAMAEKIIFQQKTIDDPKRLDTTALAGDMKEVIPEPRSPRDITYTRTEPPTLDELLMHKMISHHVRLSGRFLCLVLENARSIEFGLYFLGQSQLPERWRRALLLLGRGNDDKLRVALNEIPDHIFSSFVKFLCNFADVKKAGLIDVDIRSKHAWPIILSSKAVNKELSLLHRSDGKSKKKKAYRPEDIDHSMAFAHALQLVRLRELRYPPLSHHILQALAEDKFDPEEHRFSLSYQRVSNLWDITECLKYMADQGLLVDMRALTHTCHALNKVISTTRLNSIGASRGVQMSQYIRSSIHGEWKLYHADINDLIDTGTHMVKKYFDAMMLSNARAFDLSSTSSSSSSAAAAIEQQRHPTSTLLDPEISSTIPLMIQVPPPHLIHMMIRTFGLAEDIQGLLLLTSWLRKFEPEMTSAVEERAGGKKQMRHAVCALRLFLEEDWDKWDPVLENRRTVRDQVRMEMEGEVRDEIRGIVEDTPLLAPWPDEEEVGVYLSRQPVNE